MKRLLLAVLLAAGCRKHESGFELRAPVKDFSAALAQTCDAVLHAGQKLEVLENGKVFDALVGDLSRAKQSVDAETFIWSKGLASERVLAAIKKAHIKCRVLVDAIGSAGVDDDFKQVFADAGCEVRKFRPIPSPDNEARNHRKIFVIDGRIGYTGGFGVDDKWLGDGTDDKHWRDTNVRVEGPIVADMQRAFAGDWQEPGGDFLPADEFPPEPQAGDVKAAFVLSQGSPVVTNAERLTQLAIETAKKRLWIENAYFVPSKAILDLLGRRAAEGVDVRIVTAGHKSDSKLAFLGAQTDYGDLQKRGVRIWEYQASMIHSKSILVDDSLVVIGSVNLEPLSLNHLEEGAVVAEDPRAAQQLAHDFEGDCTRSKEQK